MPSASLPRRLALAAVALTGVVALLAAAAPAKGQLARGSFYGFQGEEGRIEDLDARPGTVAPTAAQRAIVERLGATVRWNALGTPHVLVKHGGWLATGLTGDAPTAARAWIRANRDLFRLSAGAVDALEVLRDSPLYDDPRHHRLAEPPDVDVAHVVLFRQRFGDLHAGQDGLLTVGLRRGAIAWVSSSTTGDSAVNTTVPRLDAAEAFRRAAADVGRDFAPGQVRASGSERDWTLLAAEGLADAQRARLVALPTPADGVRLAWETVVLHSHSTHEHPFAFVHFVDALDGRVWFRRNALQHLAAPHLLAQTQPVPYPPRWSTFPANPPLVPTQGVEPPENANEDTRETWCWAPATGCDRVVGEDPQTNFLNGASRFPWDVDPHRSVPTYTTDGNNADTSPSYISPFTPDQQAQRPYSPQRTYVYPWTNQWYQSRCSPSAFTSPQRNDIDASTVALNVGHNRMHDWGYYLGWTERNSNLQRHNFGYTDPRRENDPEKGQSQAGAMTGTVTPIAGRDNANQITLQDGTPGVTNQYLWQPIANAIYVPCVDGAYDMAVIAHEVTHAISNRMTAGPDTGLSGHQAGSMGESWSDLAAVEYLNGLALIPTADENPFAVGAYVTGDKVRGIRNYAMNDSPLNYSNVGYDFIGPQVHADGEIWSATQYDIRQALVRKYDAEFPASDTSLQVRCAEGLVPVRACPGNRRWIQLLFDGFLLQPSRTSMVDSRDAILAADMLRFDGANQRELWDTFALHGLGRDAASKDVNDTDPIPSFASPEADNATVTFKPVDADGEPLAELVNVYVGDYEARVNPIADNDPETPLGDVAEFVPGTHRFLVTAKGFGFLRFEETLAAGQEATIEIALQRNLASAHSGAEVTAGDGVNRDKLIDDTEATNWASLQSSGTASPRNSVEGRQVTVQLADGAAQDISRVQVSAMLRPAPPALPPPTDPDPSGQNRFSALRSFQVLACDASAGADCTKEESFGIVYTSPADAFPSDWLRPRAPDLILRSFDIPQTRATHLRLRVLTNQCTGVPWYQGSLDADPSNPTDCVTESGSHASTALPPQGENVRAAEFQAFSGPAPAVTVLTKEAPPEDEPEEEQPGSAATARLRRIAGPARVDTAVQVSRTTFPFGADTVVLARGDRYPDALAGAPLAFARRAPILLTPGDALAEATAAEIRRVGARHAILLGGPAALSQQIEDDLRAQTDVTEIERVSGPTRFDTAARIAERVGSTDVYVTRGAAEEERAAWADALAVSPLAAFQGRAILLVERDQVPEATRAALEGKRVATIAGGTGAVSAEVEGQIRELVEDVGRVHGATRYETATRLATVAEAAGMRPTETFLATGENFADALAAGPAVAQHAAVLLLVHPEDLANAPSVREYLTANADAISGVTLLGGTQAISAQVERQVGEALTPRQE